MLHQPSADRRQQREQFVLFAVFYAFVAQHRTISLDDVDVFVITGVSRRTAGPCEIITHPKRRLIHNRIWIVDLTENLVRPSAVVEPE